MSTVLASAFISRRKTSRDASEEPNRFKSTPVGMDTILLGTTPLPIKCARIDSPVVMIASVRRVYTNAPLMGVDKCRVRIRRGRKEPNNFAATPKAQLSAELWVCATSNFSWRSNRIVGIRTEGLNQRRSAIGCTTKFLSAAFRAMALCGSHAKCISQPRLRMPSISKRMRFSCPPHPRDDSLCRIFQAFPFIDAPSRRARDAGCRAAIRPARPKPPPRSSRSNTG